MERFPFNIVVSDAVPADCVLIVGEPKPIMLRPGQSGPTEEQIAEALASNSHLVRFAPRGE